MKSIRIYMVMGGILLLGIGGAWGQEATPQPTPAPSKHNKHKKAPAPPEPILTPTETLQPTPVNISTNKFEFDLYGGIATFWEKDNRSKWPVGYMAGIWAGYLMDPRAVIGLRMEYIYFSANPAGFGPTNIPFTPSPTGQTPDMNVISFIPAFKLNLYPSDNSPIQPYAMIGAGFMNLAMLSGSFPGSDFGYKQDVNVTGYSNTVPMVSLALGLPVELPDNFRIPLQTEIETGFTSGENTNLLALTLGVERDW